MSHVDGVDDGVGYGVSGKSSGRCVVPEHSGYGVYGESNSVGMVCMARAVGRWCAMALARSSDGVLAEQSATTAMVWLA